MSNGSYQTGGPIQKGIDSMIRNHVTNSSLSLQLLTPQSKIYLCVLTSRRVVATANAKKLHRYFQRSPPLALDVVNCTTPEVSNAMINYAVEIYSNLRSEDVNVLGVQAAQLCQAEPKRALKELAASTTPYRGGSVVGELFAIRDACCGSNGVSSRTNYRLKFFLCFAIYNYNMC